MASFGNADEKYFLRLEGKLTDFEDTTGYRISQLMKRSERTTTFFFKRKVLKC